MGMHRKYVPPDQSAKADLVDGKIPLNQIPTIPITEFLGTAANQAAMLAFTPDSEGDWCVRTDGNQLGFYTGGDATQIGNWLLVSLASAITTVAGRTGIVVLTKSDVGLSNIDNTSDANKPVSSQQQNALNTLQSTLTALIPVTATTSVAGIVKKGALLTSPSAHTITDNVGGTVSTTQIPALGSVGTVLSVAANVTDVTTFNTNVKNAISTLTAEQNLLKARLEELISKLQTSGVQT